MTVADSRRRQPDLAIVTRRRSAIHPWTKATLWFYKEGDGTFTEFSGSPLTVDKNPVAIAPELDGTPAPISLS